MQYFLIWVPIQLIFQKKKLTFCIDSAVTKKMSISTKQNKNALKLDEK
jgi:hypothetical protein